MEDFLVTVLPRTADKGRRHSRAVTPKYLFTPLNFVVLRQNLLKHVIKTKYFLKIEFAPPKNLKPYYGPVSAKIVSAIRIFCFEGHSASRYIA